MSSNKKKTKNNNELNINQYTSQNSDISPLCSAETQYIRRTSVLSTIDVDEPLVGSNVQPEHHLDISCNNMQNVSKIDTNETPGHINKQVCELENDIACINNNLKSSNKKNNNNDDNEILKLEKNQKYNNTEYTSIKKITSETKYPRNMNAYSGDIFLSQKQKAPLEPFAFGETGNLYINVECLNKMFNVPNYKNMENSYEIIPIYCSNEILLLKKKKFLVISGGGIRGMSFIGALKALENYKILCDIETFAGTSVGALIIVFFVIGYSIDEIFEFIKYFDVTKMSSIDSLNTIISLFGFDDGKKIDIILTKIFECKNLNSDITFNDLFIITKKEIIITSVCINTMDVVYMSYKSHPNMSVKLAVKMAISIPVLFTPILFENKYYIDGGCIDNYPIGLFKDNLDEVIGLYVETNDRIVENINTIEDYIYQLLQCITKGLANNILNGYEKSTISISIDWIPLIDIDMDINDKIKLFSRGYDVTYDYIINNLLNKSQ